MASERLARALTVVGQGLGGVYQQRMKARADEIEHKRQESLVRLRHRLESERGDVRYARESALAAARMGHEERLAATREGGVSQRHGETLAATREATLQSSLDRMERDAQRRIDTIDRRLAKLQDDLRKEEYFEGTPAHAEVQADIEELQRQKLDIRRDTLSRRRKMGDPALAEMSDRDFALQQGYSPDQVDLFTRLASGGSMDREDELAGRQSASPGPELTPEFQKRLATSRRDQYGISEPGAAGQIVGDEDVIGPHRTVAGQQDLPESPQRPVDRSKQGRGTRGGTALLTRGTGHAPPRRARELISPEQAAEHTRRVDLEVAQERDRREIDRWRRTIRRSGQALLARGGEGKVAETLKRTLRGVTFEDLTANGFTTDEAQRIIGLVGGARGGPSIQPDQPAVPGGQRG